MLVFVVDDEENAALYMKELLLELNVNEVKTFNSSRAALNAVDNGDVPNIVFSDIEMPGISGLDFAIQLKSKSPVSRIVFVTAYEKYAIEAFRIKAHGYLLKPVTKEDVSGELSYVPKCDQPVSDKLEVRCFGTFEVKWKGEPLFFARKQSKELFAFLVDRKGVITSVNDISNALWESDYAGKSELNRLRVLVSDLRKTLREVGMEDVLVRRRMYIGVRKDLLDCDYYKMLDGDIDAINSFEGRYMTEYSWSEITNGSLRFKYKKGS